MGEPFLPSVLLALAFLGVAFLDVVPLALFLCFFERPIALMSLSFLGAMVLCGGAGRGHGAGVVRGEVAGREGRREPGTPSNHTGLC